MFNNSDVSQDLSRPIHDFLPSVVSNNLLIQELSLLNESSGYFFGALFVVFIGFIASLILKVCAILKSVLPFLISFLIFLLSACCSLLNFNFLCISFVYTILFVIDISNDPQTTENPVESYKRMLFGCLPAIALGTLILANFLESVPYSIALLHATFSKDAKPTRAAAARERIEAKPLCMPSLSP
jgi:hypothetical protein